MDEVKLPFADRAEAGRVLAAHLSAYAGRPDVLVLGLPRGGVPVAFEVSRALQVPLNVLLVRKLGVPGHEELAMGAVAGGGVRVLNPEVVEGLGIPATVIDAAAEREQREIEQRERLYRGGRASPDVSGKTVILVDDGLATGSTMLAAVRAVRQAGAAEIVAAAPVAASSTCRMLEAEADGVVCAAEPEPFHAVGLWYRDFTQTSDDEVRGLLTRSAELQGTPV